MTNKQTIPYVSGSLPILGHAIEFQRDRTKLMKRGYAEHGELFSYKLASRNVAVLSGPENQRTFFMETDGKLNIQEPYRFLSAMFEDALFLAPHEQYLEQRPMVLELFKRQKMVEYIDIIQEQVQKMLDRWGEAGEIELTEEIGHLVQEVAGNCFLGAEVHEQVGREFWDAYAVLGAALDPVLPPNLPLPKFRNRDKAKARMKEIIQPIVAERRANPEKYDDILATMIAYTEREGNTITDNTILNMLLGLMFAGHETTAGQGAWVVIQLLQNRDYLTLVQAEIDAQITPRERFDHRAMAKLKHISWAVDETSRMQPSADILMRLVEEDLEVGDYVVPAGWMVQTSAEIAHNIPDLWTNPDQYDPLRFSPDRAEDKQDRFSMIGFGGGTHKCTGMNFANNEMIIIVAMLFGQYDVELISENIKVDRGLGANRPTQTFIRYQRKPS